MSYLLKTNDKNEIRKKRMRILIILGVIFLLVFGGTLKKIIAPISNPVLEPIFSTAFLLKEKVSSLFSFLIPKSNLLKENESLRKLLEEKEAEVFKLNSKINNLEYSKNLIESNLDKNLIESFVIRTPDASPYDSIIIDKGTKDGVKEGETVYSTLPIPIGKVEHAYLNTSQVKLFSTPGEKYEVVIGKENIHAEAEGRGGGNFEVFLPHGTEVKVGDSVTIPSISTHQFSSVEDVTETSGGTFVRVLFKNPYNYNNLRIVGVDKVDN